jgi:hypothetical protein
VALSAASADGHRKEPRPVRGFLLRCGACAYGMSGNISVQKGFDDITETLRF